MQQQKIAFIGAGNMANCLIGGLINANYSTENIFVSAPHEEKLNQLRTHFAIQTAKDNKKIAALADIIVIAVKPQQAKLVAQELATIVQQNKPLIISIAAGVSTTQLATYFSEEAAIVRCMPNTPALVGSGATGLYANPQVNKTQHDLAESLLRTVGITLWVDDEKQIDTITALSGSGPAYFFLIMEALQQAAEKLGLPTETARLLTLQTTLGAAKMALESTEPLSELRHHVTSPGGTTEAAIAVLEKCDIFSLFQNVLTSAKQRSEKLSAGM